MIRTDDLRISAVRPLVVPALLQEKLHAPDSALALVGRTRAAIAWLCWSRSCLSTRFTWMSPSSPPARR